MYIDLDKILCDKKLKFLTHDVEVLSSTELDSSTTAQSLFDLGHIAINQYEVGTLSALVNVLLHEIIHYVADTANIQMTEENIESIARILGAILSHRTNRWLLELLEVCDGGPDA